MKKETATQVCVKRPEWRAPTVVVGAYLFFHPFGKNLEPIFLGFGHKFVLEAQKRSRPLMMEGKLRRLVFWILARTNAKVALLRAAIHLLFD